MPAHVNSVQPRLSYQYDGELMTHTMIRSWCGILIQPPIIQNNTNVSLFSQERASLREELWSRGGV